MKRPGFQREIAAICALPGFLAILAFIYEYAGHHQRTLDFWPMVIGLSLMVALSVGWLLTRIKHGLGTITNLLSSLREGEYGIKGRIRHPGSAYDGVMAEINGLATILEDQRLGEEGALLLLDKVIQEIDAAVLVFDQHRICHRINPAGEQLLGRNRDQLVGKSASALGLARLLNQPGKTLAEMAFAGKFGRFEISCRTFREKGLSYHLMVITDLSQVLREEERKAWKRLIRVLGHELNNSLAAIQSTADTLHGWQKTDQSCPPHELEQGLAEIIQQSENLARFISRYTALARLPPPETKTEDLCQLLQRVALLYPDWEIQLDLPDRCFAAVDEGQLMQVLLNLVKNAIEAMAESPGELSLRLTEENGRAVVAVIDEGPGLEGDDNLFVPFYTTKPQGAGIGLVLSRQIAEAHDGSLTLRNRQDRPGCVALLTIPLSLTGDK